MSGPDPVGEASSDNKDGETRAMEPFRCSVCSRLNYDFFKSRHSPAEFFKPTFFSMGSFARIFESSETCPLCRVIYCHLVYQATSHQLLKRMIIVVADVGLHLTQGDELLVVCNTEAGRLKLCDYMSDTIPLHGADSLPSKSSTSLKRLLNPAHTDNGPLVFGWLATCEHEHDRCSTNVVGAPLLPTHVVDVGIMNDDPEDDCCCLVLSEGRHAEYVTLSHCWGGVHHDMVLRSDNMASMLAGFPDSALPQTFQDAVWLTRQLRKRYLWIDSLCIIQPTAEDDSDWATEGSKMSDVYSNSWLTIAASSTYNSSQGCLFGRLESEFEIRPARLFEHATRREWDGGANSPLPTPCEWSERLRQGGLATRAYHVPTNVNQFCIGKGEAPKTKVDRENNIPPPRIISGKGKLECSVRFANSVCISGDRIRLRQASKNPTQTRDEQDW